MVWYGPGPELDKNYDENDCDEEVDDIEDNDYHRGFGAGETEVTLHMAPGLRLPGNDASQVMFMMMLMMIIMKMNMIMIMMMSLRIINVAMPVAQMRMVESINRLSTPFTK